MALNQVMSSIVRKANQQFGEMLELTYHRTIQTAHEKGIDAETIAAVLDLSVEEVNEYIALSEAEVLERF